MADSTADGAPSSKSPQRSLLHILRATFSASTDAKTDEQRETNLEHRAIRPVWRDVGVGALYLTIALFYTYGLWRSPHGRGPTVNLGDQTLQEWFLAYASRLWLGDISLISDRMNSPVGFNIMANTSMLFPGSLLAPVTWLFGAPVTLAVLATANLAVTALGWYLLFARALGIHRVAAATAGGLCGFAPVMLAHTQAHVNLTAQWLIPPIVYCVLRLYWGRTPDVTGFCLGLLIIAQAFTTEEVLFLTAVTLGLLTCIYPIFDRHGARRAVRPMLIGLGIAVMVSLLLLRPLRVQFAGPMKGWGGLYPPEYFAADVASYLKFSPLTLAGPVDDAGKLGNNPVELNTFLGWPLLLVLIAAIVYQWRIPFVRAATGTGLILIALSLGPEIVINGKKTGIPGPFKPLHGFPVLEWVIPSRFAMALVPLIAAILALAMNAALQTTRPLRLRLIFPVYVALLPLLPLPMPTTDRPAVPTFFTQGHWRECVSPGGVLVPVPIPNPRDSESMRWATAANAAFGIPEGTFIGPFGFGYPSQPTSLLLREVLETGVLPPIGEEQRLQARADAEYWKTSCIALGPTQNRDQLRMVLDQLYGPGRAVNDAWVWQPNM